MTLFFTHYLSAGSLTKIGRGKKFFLYLVWLVVLCFGVPISGADIASIHFDMKSGRSLRTADYILIIKAVFPISDDGLMMNLFPSPRKIIYMCFPSCDEAPAFWGGKLNKSARISSKELFSPFKLSKWGEIS